MLDQRDIGELSSCKSLVNESEDFEPKLDRGDRILGS